MRIKPLELLFVFFTITIAFASHLNALPNNGRWDCLFSQYQLQSIFINENQLSADANCFLSPSKLATFTTRTFADQIAQQQFAYEIESLLDLNLEAEAIFNALLDLTQQNYPQAVNLYMQPQALPTLLVKKIKALHQNLFYLLQSSNLNRQSLGQKVKPLLHPFFMQILIDYLIGWDQAYDSGDGRYKEIFQDDNRIIKAIGFLLSLSSQQSCFRWGIYPVATVFILRNSKLFDAVLLFKQRWTIQSKVLPDCPLDIKLLPVDKSVQIYYNPRYQSDFTGSDTHQRYLEILDHTRKEYASAIQDYVD